MPRYRIEVGRRVDLVRYDYGSIEVDAESEKEAKKLAHKNFDCGDVDWNDGETEQVDQEEEFDIHDVELSDDQPEEEEPEEDVDDEPEEVFDEEEGVYLTVGGKI